MSCWSWAAHPELYAGKHQTTGMTVQVACTLTGGLAWISDPSEGSRHDTYCLTESGVLPVKPATGWATKGMSATTCSPPSKNPLTGTCWTGKKSSTDQPNPLRH
ncbi:MAG: transposase family protein [Actinobacteria bacterium]|nr:transposase family protein [Actinomycetota bacterium]